MEAEANSCFPDPLPQESVLVIQAPVEQDPSFADNDESSSEDLPGSHVPLNCFSCEAYIGGIICGGRDHATYDSTRRPDDDQASLHLGLPGSLELDSAREPVLYMQTEANSAREPIHSVPISTSCSEPVWNFQLKGDLANFRVEAENGESIDMVPEMEAICIICDRLLQEGTTVLKEKCRCELISLLHEKCAPEKKEDEKCYGCEEVVQYIRVTLSLPTPEDLKKPTSGKRLWNWFQKLFRPLNGKTS